MRDPELSGRRARVEAECLARRATYEIWTERELTGRIDGWPLLDIATPTEAAAYADPGLDVAREGTREEIPGLVRRVATRFLLTEPRWVGECFVARSLVTGIVMGILRDLRKDPATGMRTWSFVDRTTHGTTDGAYETKPASLLAGNAAPREGTRSRDPSAEAARCTNADPIEPCPSTDEIVEENVRSAGARAVATQ